jgi:Protein of unknown function (DUF2688)
MKRSRFHLVPTTCRRCGATLLTGSRSLVGTAAMKARYGAICAGCFTAEESEAMDQDYRHLLFGAARMAGR